MTDSDSNSEFHAVLRAIRDRDRRVASLESRRPWSDRDVSALADALCSYRTYITKLILHGGGPHNNTAVPNPFSPDGAHLPAHWSLE